MTDQPPDYGDGRNLSSPVPVGPSSEPGAAPGTGASAPAPVAPAPETDALPTPPSVDTDRQPASDVPDQSSTRQR